MFVAVAVGAAAGVIGAGAQMYSSNQAAKSAKSIANQELAQKQEQFDYQRSLQEPFYEGALPAYRSLVSGITGQVDPNTGKAWTPTNSPAYEWQKQQTEKAMGRKLRALGRENSTFGMNAMAESNRNLAAGEYDRQLGRLSDLTNIARGGASSLVGISGNRQGALSNFAEGQLAGNLIGQQGINNAIGTGMSGLNLAANLYKQPTLSNYSSPALSGAENSYGVLAQDSGYKWGA